MSITLTNKFDEPQKAIIKEETKCTHCGEVCPDESIHLEDHLFCCEGCKMVYEILHENNLSQYYRIENKPGISLKTQKRERYAWLDDEEIASKLIDFQNDKITRLTFLLPQIHCASCIWLLENLYKLDDGIVQSKVNFLKKEAYLTFDHQKLTIRKVVELLALIGYPPAINLSNLDESQTEKSIDRTFYYQIGVAGFAFGNIMLLSFPEYLGLVDNIFQRWFGYLNILLAIPVLVFSGRNYIKSAWHGLRQGNLNIDVPITLGILTLFGRSVFEILSHTGAGYLDSLAGLIFFLLIGKWFQQKTYYQLSFERDYKSYFPIAATIKKEGKEDSVALNKLEIGDIVVVRHKELVPADGILIKGKGRIDYSFVTGESEPVRIKNGEKVFAGGRQMSENIELTLTKKVSQSYLTQLWNEDTFNKEDNSNASHIADTIGKYFTYAILTIAFATLIYWLINDKTIAFNSFTAVLIIACPCAVALSIPFTFGNAIRLLAKRGFYLKNTQVIENLAKIDAVVFDKTGTITNAEKSKIQYEGEALNEFEKSAIRSLTHQSSHPVSRLINSFLGASALLEVIDFEELTGKGIRGKVNGLSIEIGSNGWLTKNNNQKGTFVKINEEIKGKFRIQNSYRKGFEKLLSNWKNLFQSYLLSGDNDQEKTHLETQFGTENLHFNQSPKDKLQFIKKLQENKKFVLMLGDGLNDAGALHQSNVGIVVAENTNNFTPSCDAILDAKKFPQLTDYQLFAKKSVKLVYWAYSLAFIYNIIGLSFAVQGLLSPVIAAILMPLSSITIVFFGVLASEYLAKKVLK
ncbi:heavy metal translocating P-type ATPase metal-binding domain-containing protein [Saprospiraceae bacterium]|nr:heavy metal translocating P-type ATPase metal-binding domain-containing protein [Saprospiraceae bacterium]